MPILAKAYKCPICNALHPSEHAAEACAEECLKFELFEEGKAYACCRCGEMFKSESSAILHEKNCIVHPKDCDEEIPESCFTCNNMDAEGHRYRPCPEAHFAPMRKACGNYVLATK